MLLSLCNLQGNISFNTSRTSSQNYLFTASSCSLTVLSFGHQCQFTVIYIEVFIRRIQTWVTQATLQNWVNVTQGSINQVFAMNSVTAYSIGCYRDTGRRAILPLEGRSRLLRGSYRRRRYALQKCALAAQRRGYRVFALQHGGWCASTRRAHLTYRRYGKSNKCRNGKGGPWANDVYVLRGKCVLF